MYLCFGAGYLNGWNFQDKLLMAETIETTAGKTRFIDEEPEGCSIGR
jgi:hypothetical protein